MTNLPAAIKHFSGNGYDHTVEHLQFSGVPTTVIDTGLQTKGHTNSRGSRVAPWSYTTYQSEPETDIAGYGIRAKVIWRTASTSKGRVYDNVGTPTVTLFKRDAGATSRPGIKTKKDKESEVAFEYPCPVDHAQIVAALVGAGETPEAARVYEDAISHGKKEACDRKLWSMTSFHISNAKDPQHTLAVINAIASFIDDPHYQERIERWKLPEDQALYISANDNAGFIRVMSHHGRQTESPVNADYAYYSATPGDFHGSSFFMYPKFRSPDLEEVMAYAEQQAVKINEKTPYETMRDTKVFKTKPQWKAENEAGLKTFQNGIQEVEALLAVAVSTNDFREVREMLAPLAEPIMDQVKGAILPKIRNGYGWYPDPFPTDFSSEENEYKVKNAFAGLPEELKGAYQTILTMQNTLSKEIGAAVPTPAVTEAPAPVQTEPSFPAPLAPRPSKSERVRESADAAYTVAEIQEKWEQVKDTPETMPADYLEALRMHYEISQNKGDKKKIEKMEVHNADREKAALEKTINDCTTSPDMLPPDAKGLLAMFHAIEKHGLLLPENAKLTLMERAMNVGDDDLASRIDAYSIPKAQVSAVAQSQPMQVRSSRQKS